VVECLLSKSCIQSPVLPKKKTKQNKKTGGRRHLSQGPCVEQGKLCDWSAWGLSVEQEPEMGTPSLHGTEAELKGTEVFAFSSAEQQVQGHAPFAAKLCPLP
jgi:hypothetical protein